MYQPLIWSAVNGYQASRLRPTLYAQDLKRAANALVDRMWRDSEFARNLFGRKMLVDEAQAIELPRAQPRDAPLNLVSVPLVADCPIGHALSPLRDYPVGNGCAHPNPRNPKPIRRKALIFRDTVED